MRKTRKILFWAIAFSLCPVFSSDADFLKADGDFYLEKEHPPGQEKMNMLLRKKTISLMDLLELAGLCNPDIVAANNSISAAEGRLHQAGLYANPVIGLEIEDLPGENIDLQQARSMIALVQPIIIGKRRSAAKSEAAEEQALLRLSLQNTKNKVLGDVYLSYLDLAFNISAYSLYTDLQVLTKTIHDIAQARFEARAIPENELIAIKLTAIKLELDKNKTKRHMSIAAKRLQSFFAGVPLPVDRIRANLKADLPEIDLDRLLSVVYDLHPAVKAANKTVSLAERRSALVKAERFPDLNLRGAYGKDQASGETIIELGISMSLPIFNRNQGRISEMHHLAIQASNASKSSTARLEFQVVSAQATYIAAREYAEAYRSRILPAMEKTFTRTMEGYRAGRAEISRLHQALQGLVSARLTVLETTRDLNNAFASIYKLTGPMLFEIIKKQEREKEFSS